MDGYNPPAFHMPVCIVPDGVADRELWEEEHYWRFYDEFMWEEENDEPDDPDDD